MESCKSVCLFMCDGKKTLSGDDDDDDVFACVLYNDVLDDMLDK